ncbi:RtcB family protein [Trichlorobacter ammonificans]|uniref:3'-phosphate/5'-hydroxy nucleic acid ligase n=1 Tax=Trichlorobacter ammonificans TaxID=2916410 RepID=A0ABM9DA68_9BACT|nr:RtcB family protein [Trichlorobacter ammonificans]CAH2031678.1 Protein RtcB [Trichlorobacter ammonificans]
MATTTLIHADLLDPTAAEQIRQIADHPVISGQVAIMPDAHAGAGCVIGFTGRFGDGVIPNIVGVDIGCGVAAVPLPGVRSIDFAALDRYIRNQIPLGMQSRKSDRFLTEYVVPKALEKELQELCRHLERGFYEGEKIGKHIPPLLQAGTLGGGNHFIEIGRNDAGGYHLIVHSGSRNLGKRVAEHFQQRARRTTEEQRIRVPRGLEFLPLKEGGRDYLRWMAAAQRYAALNRRMMLLIMLRFFELELEEAQVLESVHNYIAEDDGIVRKGAISAHQGERVIIPLNMADGTLIGTGLGNPAYNRSAPHGAGRLHGRKEMFRRLKEGQFSMQQYADSMEHVFSTSVNRETFDESRFAYKPLAAIEHHLRETVTVEQRLTPVYNLKAAGD